MEKRVIGTGDRKKAGRMAGIRAHSRLRRRYWRDARPLRQGRGEFLVVAGCGDSPLCPRGAFRIVAERGVGDTVDSPRWGR